METSTAERKKKKNKEKLSYAIYHIKSKISHQLAYKNITMPLVT